MGEVCFPIEMELKSGKQGEGCLSQCKIESGKCKSVRHLQPKAGDPANVDFTQRKTDWIPVRSTRMTEIIFLPNKGGSGWGETPLLESVAHCIRTSSFFPNRGRKTSLYRDENDNRFVPSPAWGRLGWGIDYQVQTLINQSYLPHLNPPRVGEEVNIGGVLC